MRWGGPSMARPGYIACSRRYPRKLGCSFPAPCTAYRLVRIAFCSSLARKCPAVNRWQRHRESPRGTRSISLRGTGLNRPASGMWITCTRPDNHAASHENELTASATCLAPRMVWKSSIGPPDKYRAFGNCSRSARLYQLSSTCPTKTGFEYQTVVEPQQQRSLVAMMAGDNIARPGR